MRTRGAGEEMGTGTSPEAALPWSIGAGSEPVPIFSPPSMLDFRKALKHREGLGPRQYRPLLMLILLLGIAAILADNARGPGFLATLDRLASSSPEVPMTAIDNRLDAAPRKAAIPDSFLMAAEGPEEQAADQGGGYFPGVEPGELRVIRDDRPSLRDEEPCSLRLLDILNKTDAAELRKASIGPITYAQLFRQPDDYRGRLVTVSGVVRGAEPLDIHENKYGIKSYYQVWLFPLDNPSSPLVIYCLDLPKGFPTGMKLAQEAELTGFFLKRWAYSTPDADRTAPMLLAKNLQWRKQSVVAPPPSLVDIRWIPLVVIVAAALAVFTAWHVFLRSTPPRLDLPDRPPDFGRLRLEGEVPEQPVGVEKREDPQ
jgi:hypothetical protein